MRKGRKQPVHNMSQARGCYEFLYSLHKVLLVKMDDAIFTTQRRLKAAQFAQLLMSVHVVHEEGLLIGGVFFAEGFGFGFIEEGEI